MTYRLFILFIIFTALCQPVPSLAQGSGSASDNGPWPAGDDYNPQTSEQNICFTVTSEVDHTVYAQVISNYYKNSEGSWARHRHNFRIDKGERYPVCTTGPFYSERSVLIQVKSLIPLLSCYFDLGNGGRELKFYKREIAGKKRLWATCKVTYPDISDLAAP